MGAVSEETFVGDGANVVCTYLLPPAQNTPPLSVTPTADPTTAVDAAAAAADIPL